MNTANFKLAVWLSLLPAFSQCSLVSRPAMPAVATLPPVTEAGLNTLGFRVDGSLWLPVGSFNFPAYKAYYQNNTFWIRGSRLVEGKLSTFGIYLKPLRTGPGTYDLLERSGVGASYTETAPDDELVVQRPRAGTLRLTRLDSVQRILAGTFECELTSPTSGRTVRITDGRFDLTY